MKVGILTFHSSYNYGANLQALALQGAVAKAGATPVIVNYQNTEKMETYRAITSPAQADQHEKFIARYLLLGPLLTSSREIEQFCFDTLDTIIVGSDQVFRLPPKYDIRKVIKRILGRNQTSVSDKADEQLPPYWLDWHSRSYSRRVIKAAVAASAGSTSFYLIDIKLYKKLYRVIKGFQYVSVRDSWTGKMISVLSLGRIVPEFCPDPVFALNESLKIPDDERIAFDPSKTILISLEPDSDWMARFVEETHKIGYRVATLPNPDREYLSEEADLNFTLPMSPLHWYQLLAKAAGYIGLRYHALISCLSNQTPVITVETTPAFSLNFQAKSRHYDVCKRAGILDRYIQLPMQKNRLEPQTLLKTLFSDISQAKANAFASSAAKRFYSTIEHILNLRQP